MIKFDAISGILAVKTISLGLFLLVLFILQSAIWATRNIVIPTGFALARFTIWAIKMLNAWCDAQSGLLLEPCIEVKIEALPPGNIKGLLVAAKPRILLTPPILPSSNNVIATRNAEARLAATLFGKKRGRPKKASPLI